MRRIGATIGVVLGGMGIMGMTCGRPATEPEEEVEGIQPSQALVVVQRLLTGVGDIQAYRPQGLAVGFHLFRALLCPAVPTGDPTDRDQDGIFVNAQVTFECDTVINDKRYRLYGRVSFQDTDTDDEDPWAGGVVMRGPEGTGEFLLESTGGSHDTTHVEIGGTAQSGREGAQYVVDLNLSVNVFRVWVSDTLRYAYTFGGWVRFEPEDGTWNPVDRGYVPGLLTVEGAFQHVGDPLLRLRTPEAMRMEAGCQDSLVAEEPFLPAVSGVLEGGSGTDTLQIRWTGCGQYVVLLNGDTVSTESVRPEG